MNRKFQFAASLSCLMLAAGPALSSEPVRQIFISKSDQMMRVYDNAELTASVRISTGKKNHETPSGLFSIIEKRKYHESNIYSNAPMPFMQRITWSGIALHEGHVPNYPASHGCIRIPKAWASKLYGMTKRSTGVVITRDAVAPSLISHAALPGKQRAAPQLLVSQAVLRPALTDLRQEVALLDDTQTQSIEPIVDSDLAARKNQPPLKLLITWRSARDRIASSQKKLTYLGFDAGTADGLIGATTNNALRAFKRWKNIDPKAELMSEPVQQALTAASYVDPMSNGTLQLRQNFKPLTEFDVTISQATLELGTHVLQAAVAPSTDASSQWVAVTVPNTLSPATRQRLGLQSAALATSPKIEDVLGRIDLSQAAKDFLEENFSTQMSLTITDYSHDQETGQGTEFITVTRD